MREVVGSSPTAATKIMSYYTQNANFHGWGPDSAQLNLEKLSLLDKFAQGKIIDIGTGSGIYANYLAQRGHQVTAIDQEKEFINQAKAKFPQINFKQASALNLPFKDQTFDTAILFDILEHLDDFQALQEATRVAKRVIISVPRTNQTFLTKWSLAHHHYLDRTHLRTYTLDSLNNLLAQASLQSIYLQEALPISLRGATIDYLCSGNKLKKVLLKVLLKPFSDPQPIYSTIFAVVDK